MRQGIYSAPKYFNNYSTVNTKKWPEDIQCIIRSTNPQKGSLYLSNVQAAQNPSTVKKLRIGAILTCAKGYQLSHPRSLVPLYMYIAGQDKQSFDISIHFDQAVNFIEQALQKTNIIVHCIAGVSRSVSMVIAYFIKNMNLSYNEAFYEVKSKRKIINPNQGFVQHLKRYEIIIKNKNKKQSKTYLNENEKKDQNNEIQKYKKSTIGTFYTPKKSIEYYRNIQSSKNMRNPQLPLRQSVINIKSSSIHESGVYYPYSPRRNLQKNDNIINYERFSKSMSMIPNDNRPKTSKNIQNNYYTTKIISNKQDNLSPKKINNYLSQNKSTTLTRNQLLYNQSQAKNGYFDSMNSELNQKIQAIRKKYQQQRQQMIKGYNSRQSTNIKQQNKNIYKNKNPQLQRINNNKKQDPQLQRNKTIKQKSKQNNYDNSQIKESYCYLDKTKMGGNYELGYENRNYKPGYEYRNYEKSYENRNYNKGYQNAQQFKRYDNRQIRMHDSMISRYNPSYGSIYGSYASRRYY